jgi:hypothetical protein
MVFEITDAGLAGKAVSPAATATPARRCSTERWSERFSVPYVELSVAPRTMMERPTVKCVLAADQLN